jgi:hypothetical protein
MEGRDITGERGEGEIRRYGQRFGVQFLYTYNPIVITLVAAELTYAYVVDQNSTELHARHAQRFTSILFLPGQG